MKTLLILAGIGQICLAIGSTVIPKLLKWKEETAKLSKLTGQVFWTYAVYILTINFSFGLLSVLLPDSLTDGSSLAIAVSGFITLYWLSRLMIQFFYFDRSAAPKGMIFTLGEIGLVALFIFFTATYFFTLVENLTQ
jgi:hypothetical protein